MNTFEAIYERRSTREFVRGRQVPEETLNRIMASSLHTLHVPGGQIPWRMIVVRDQVTKDLLADCAREVAMMMFGASFEVFGLGHLWYLPNDTRLAVAEYTLTGELWEYPRDADVCFIPVYSNMAWVDTIPSFTSTIDLYLQYVGFSTQNMWLVGHKYGIGAGYNGMPLLDVRRRETISEHLGIPWSWEPTGAFCFGYAKGPRYFGPARPPLEGVTFSEYWGNPHRRMALTETGYQTMKLPITEIEETIANLNFVDSFDDGAVPPWMIEKVLDTALWGPVPENFKNWRFMVIRDAASKEFLRALVSEKKYCPWTYAWPELQHARAAGLVEEERLAAAERALEKDLGAWITQADTIILVLSCVFNWRDQPYPGLAAGPNHMFAISTGCCTQNMFIAASALGLGIAYDVLASGDERTRELMNDYFGIPATTWVPLGILGLGRPGKKVALPPVSLAPLVYEEHWGNPYPIRTT